MPDSKRFFHPETIRRITRLELRARHIVEGFLSGLHRSPYFGQSIEFLQHREYAPGDDLRHVDWKVWARQDRMYVKQYEEDTNLRCHLLVDVSASMQYGNGPLNKYDYACTLATSLAYLLLRHQDAVGCLAFDEQVRSQAPARSKRTHLETVVRSLSVAEPRDKTRLDRVLKNAAEMLPRRGMIVLISDFLVDLQTVFQGLRMLKHRGHEVLIFHVLDDDELDFPFSGPTRFEGLETVDHLNCNPRALRDGYLEALQQFLTELRRHCAQQNFDYSLVRTRQPLDVSLVSYLSSRMGTRRIRH